MLPACAPPSAVTVKNLLMPNNNLTLNLKASSTFFLSLLAYSTKKAPGMRTGDYFEGETKVIAVNTFCISTIVKKLS